jgi:hypothetical protein
VTFFLGTHLPRWVMREQFASVPLFISAVRLRKMKPGPRATGAWALDSGGFNAIRKYGRYSTTPKEFAAEVRRWRDEIGGMEWCAIQDWMCEPFMLEKTGLSVEEHQRRTVRSWFDLNEAAPELPWVPVLQGFASDDYQRCVDLYESAGVNLAALRLVGLGSVCRRQGTKEAAYIVKRLYARGLHNLHGFGFKTLGLTSRLKIACYLKSSDSMAWSFRANKAFHFDGKRLCNGNHEGACNNCMDWALLWRSRLLPRIERRTKAGTQGLIF